jgi:hypothetical protein
MMQRIMQSDLDAALKTYTLRLKALGMETEGIALINGNKRLGNSFNLIRINPENGGHEVPPGVSGGFLGWTKGEAYDRLCTINYTLADVLYHLES